MFTRSVIYGQSMKQSVSIHTILVKVNVASIVVRTSRASNDVLEFPKAPEVFWGPRPRACRLMHYADVAGFIRIWGSSNVAMMTRRSVSLEWVKLLQWRLLFLLDEPTSTYNRSDGCGAHRGRPAAPLKVSVTRA